MAIIGFLFLLVLGCWFIAAGLGQALLSAGFTGKAGFFWLPVFLVGVALIVLALKLSPFTIHLKP